MPTEDIVFRLANWDTPLWINPNRAPRRYNRSESGPTQYLSLHPLTPWAEWLRASGVRSIAGLREIRGRLWAAKVDLEQALTVDFDNCREFGLDPESLVSDDYEPCQDFAERCRDDPALRTTIIVPSAALPGTRNVVVFGERIAIPFSSKPLDAVDVPVSIAAEDGAPPDVLLDHVRYFDLPHDELEAWRRGDEFVITLPSIAPLLHR